MDNIENDLVSLTKGAVKQALLLQNSEKKEFQRLRIGVEGGGCSGLSYILKYDEIKADDIEFTIEGIDLIMNKAHIMYLSGMTIDFQEGLASRGFTFKNPHAQTTCGCGSSFAV